MYADRYERFQQINKIFQKKNDSNPFIPLLSPFNTRIMARSEQGKSTRINRDWTKKRSVIATPISLEYLMGKEVQSPTQDGDIRELSVLADPTNEQSTKIKRKIRILNHPKNLIEVLCARLAIGKGLIGNNITMGPNQYRFTRTFLDGEALHIFDLKLTELRQETVVNLNLVMNHVVAYFGPKDCLSKQKRYLGYKMEKPRKLTTRQYVGLVCDLNSKMAQLPPLFQEIQKLDESELVYSLANKAPRSHKAMLISQGFDPETGDLETFVEHFECTETTDDISGAKFSASDEDSDARKKKRLKSKDEHGNKLQKQHSKLYCYFRG